MSLDTNRRLQHLPSPFSGAMDANRGPPVGSQWAWVSVSCGVPVTPLCRPCVLWDLEIPVTLFCGEERRESRSPFAG